MEDLVLGIGSRVEHPEFGKGVVIQVYDDSYEITFMDFGVKSIARTFDKLKVLDYKGSDDDLVSFSKVEKVFRKLLTSMTDMQETIPLGDKWRGGMLILKPASDSLKPKEMPIETFFHKIVMLRDRVRVMEQKVNSSKGLDDEEKVAIQQYITRIYGSLTSFNVLFDFKEHHFRGDSSKS